MSTIAAMTVSSRAGRHLAPEVVERQPPWRRVRHSASSPFSPPEAAMRIAASRVKPQADPLALPVHGPLRSGHVDAQVLAVHLDNQPHDRSRNVHRLTSVPPSTLAPGGTASPAPSGVSVIASGRRTSAAVSPAVARALGGSRATDRGTRASRRGRWSRGARSSTR